jgi:hypothetical protein
MVGKDPDKPSSGSETAQRLDKALRRSFAMSPQPHKPVGKTKERPASKGRVRKGRSRS